MCDACLAHTASRTRRQARSGFNRIARALFGANGRGKFEMPVTNAPIVLTRDTEVVEIPSGLNNKLPAGTVVRVMQNLGTTYTVYSDYGLMYRIDAKDADALGLADQPAAEAAPQSSEPFSEKMVWDQLKTV